MLIICYRVVNNQHWPFMSPTSLSRSWHYKKKKKKKKKNTFETWVCLLWIASMTSIAFDLSCVAFGEMAQQFIFSSRCVCQGWINNNLSIFWRKQKCRLYLSLLSNHVNWSWIIARVQKQRTVTSVSLFCSFKPILVPTLILFHLLVSCWGLLMHHSFTLK